MSSGGSALNSPPDRRVLLALPILAVVAFVCGYYGIKDGSRADRLYYALQLFVLHGHKGEHDSLLLHVARFLAPSATFFGAARVLLPVFDERLRRLRARWMSGQVVVAGEGRLAAVLAEDFHARGKRVVWIAPDGPQAHVLRRRFVTLQGDLASLSTLGWTRLSKCERIVIAGPDDDANLRLLGRMDERLESGSRSGTIPAHVHIHDLELQRLFKRQRAVGRAARLHASVFNHYEKQARSLMAEHPLDRVQIAADSPSVVRFLIVGYGRMGQSLLLQAARLGHFANQKRLEITVFDLEAEAFGRAFAHRYPGLAEVVSVEFVKGDANDPQLLTEIEKRASQPHTLATLALCLPQDSFNARLALELRASLGRTSTTPILVRIATQEGLRRVLREPGGEGAPLVGCGELESAKLGDHLLHSDIDLLARTIHEDYVRTQLQRGTADNPALRPWDRLDEELRSSNRHQGDHIPVKLRALGCEIVARGKALRPFAGFQPGEVEILARMEHERWRAERFLEGWRLAPQKDVDRRESPYLVPWEKLTDEVKGWDRNAVENIPRLVGLTEREITR